MFFKLVFFDGIESSLPSGFLNRLVNHNSNIDSNHNCHEDNHRKAHLELLHVVPVEMSEAQEVIQLNQAEEVIDYIHDVILK